MKRTYRDVPVLFRFVHHLPDPLWLRLLKRVGLFRHSGHLCGLECFGEMAEYESACHRVRNHDEYDRGLSAGYVKAIEERRRSP